VAIRPVSRDHGRWKLANPKSEWERKMQQAARARGWLVVRHNEKSDRYVVIDPQSGAIVAGQGDGLTDEKLADILASKTTPAI
jgi:hypothetical protein